MVEDAAEPHRTSRKEEGGKRCMAEGCQRRRLLAAAAAAEEEEAGRPVTQHGDRESAAD